MFFYSTTHRMQTTPPIKSGRIMFYVSEDANVLKRIHKQFFQFFFYSTKFSFQVALFQICCKRLTCFQDSEKNKFVTKYISEKISRNFVSLKKIVFKFSLFFEIKNIFSLLFTNRSICTIPSVSIPQKYTFSLYAKL